MRIRGAGGGKREHQQQGWQARYAAWDDMAQEDGLLDVLDDQLDVDARRGKYSRFALPTASKPVMTPAENSFFI